MYKEFELKIEELLETTGYPNHEKIIEHRKGFSSYYDSLDDLATSLKIKYGFLDNFEEIHPFVEEISLANKFSTTEKAHEWLAKELFYAIRNKLL